MMVVANTFLASLRTVPTNSKVFLLLTMREKEILTNVIEIQKKLGVSTHFSKIINQQYL